MFSKRDAHEGINTFKMPEVPYTQFNENHHLWFSVVFFAPSRVKLEDLKHSVSADSTTLAIDCVMPLKYLSAQNLLGVFVWSITGKTIYPPGLLRAVAMTETLNQLFAGWPNDSSRRPMFRQVVQLLFVCALNLVRHAGGYSRV